MFMRSCKSKKDRQYKCDKMTSNDILYKTLHRKQKIVHVLLYFYLVIGNF